MLSSPVASCNVYYDHYVSGTPGAATDPTYTIAGTRLTFARTATTNVIISGISEMYCLSGTCLNKYVLIRLLSGDSTHLAAGSTCWLAKQMTAYPYTLTYADSDGWAGTACTSGGLNTLLDTVNGAVFSAQICADATCVTFERTIYLPTNAKITKTARVTTTNTGAAATDYFGI